MRVWWSVTTNLARLDQRLRHVHACLALYRIGGEEPILVLMVSVLCLDKAHDQQVSTYSLKYSTAAWSDLLIVLDYKISTTCSY